MDQQRDESRPRGMHYPALGHRDVSSADARGGGVLCDDVTVQVTLQYFDGCPSWKTAAARVRQVLDATGRAGVAVNSEMVETPKDAERLGFVGSPTLLIDGRDPFASPGAAVGLACRLYRGPDGLTGSPTVEQLMEVLA